MALDTTLSSHVDVPSDNEATNTIPTSLISFKKGAGPGSYYYFESNPNAKLHKTRACECLSTLKYLDVNHVAEYLDEMIPDAFQHEAAKNRITLDQLVEILKFKTKEFEKTSSVPAVARNEKMLATMIAMVGPDLSPDQLVEHFKELCSKEMEAAHRHLIECEQRHGRTKERYIRLRAKAKKTSHSTPKSAHEGPAHPEPESQAPEVPEHAEAGKLESVDSIQAETSDLELDGVFHE